MYNLNAKDLYNNDYKQGKKLYYNLKLIANTKNTSHLIRIKIIEKETLLVEERRPVDGVYFILEGKIKVYNKVENRKIQILRLVSKGDIVGLSSLNSSHYFSSAVAIEKVKAYCIEHKNLKSVLNNNNKLCFLLLNSLAMRIQYYEMRLKHQNLFLATERVVDALLLIAYKFGKTTDEGLEISTCTSRKDIASFANISYEKAVRTLSYLKSKKYIVLEGKKIIIKDTDVLINQIKQYLYKGLDPTDLNLRYPNLFY